MTNCDDDIGIQGRFDNGSSSASTTPCQHLNLAEPGVSFNIDLLPEDLKKALLLNN